MVFRAGRIGRPGLLGTVARTAVVAGTAQATSNAVNRRAQQRQAEAQAYTQEQYRQDQYRQEAPQYAAPPPPPPRQPPPPPPPQPPADDLIARIRQLQELHESGALTDDEFSAAKAKLLR